VERQLAQMAVLRPKIGRAKSIAYMPKADGEATLPA
jgi:hypothetical protein